MGATGPGRYIDGSRAHKGVLGFVEVAAEGDEFFFWRDPDSCSKLFVR